MYIVHVFNKEGMQFNDVIPVDTVSVFFLILEISIKHFEGACEAPENQVFLKLGMNTGTGLIGSFFQNNRRHEVYKNPLNIHT